MTREIRLDPRVAQALGVEEQPAPRELAIAIAALGGLPPPEREETVGLLNALILESLSEIPSAGPFDTGDYAQYAPYRVDRLGREDRLALMACADDLGLLDAVPRRYGEGEELTPYRGAARNLSLAAERLLVEFISRLKKVPGAPEPLRNA